MQIMAELCYISDINHSLSLKKIWNILISKVLDFQIFQNCSMFNTVEENFEYPFRETLKNNNIFYSGGAVVVGALRTTLPLVCGTLIKIRKKQRWFTQKKSFLRSFRNILTLFILGYLVQPGIGGGAESTLRP